MKMLGVGFGGLVVAALGACTVTVPEGAVQIDVSQLTKADAGPPTHGTLPNERPTVAQPPPTSPPVAPPPLTRPATTPISDPNPPPLPSRPPETCESVAADPRPDFRGQMGNPGDLGITPLDMYAFAGGIDRFDSPNAPPVFRQNFLIVMTTTPHECRYRESSLVPIHENSIRIVFNHVAASPEALEVRPGTYSGTGSLEAERDGLYLERDTADRCIPPLPDGSPPRPVGPFATVTPLSGDLIITARTATEITGSFNVRTPDGKVFTADFVAPICGEPQPNPNAPPYGCCQN